VIGLSSVLRPRQHSIGYMGDGFYRSKDPTNSIKVLKGTAPTEGRVARPERRWGCRRGTPRTVWIFSETMCMPLWFMTHCRRSYNRIFYHQWSVVTDSSIIVLFQLISLQINTNKTIEFDNTIISSF